MPRTAAITVHVDPQLKDAILRAAAADRRSVSAWLELELIRLLTERGYLAHLTDEDK